jgi:ABC-type branched-subunit amino acid transport system substrate-binding protein
MSIRESNRAGLRSWIVAAVVVALFAAATGTASAAQREGATSTPGVTKDEILLGVPYIDLESVRNIVNIDVGDQEKVYRVVIDDLNAHGGISGRKVVPVFAPYSPLGTAPAQDACLKLTEDRRVFAATGLFLADGPLCYLAQHETPILGGEQTAERLSQATAPWYTLEADDQVNAQAVDALANDGAFKGGKLGIIVDADSEALYDNVVAPALKRHKVSGTTAHVTATQGDELAIEAQVGPIIERFKSEGVKKIFIVGTTIVQLAKVLSKLDYRPQLIVLNANNLRAYTLNPGSDLDVVQNAISANVATDFNEPALQKCFKLVSKATGYDIKENPPQSEPQYRGSAEAACRYLALFAALAGAAGKNPTVESFGKAAAKLGTVDIPGSGTVTYDKKLHRFQQPVYIFRYDPATKLVLQDDKPSA